MAKLRMQLSTGLPGLDRVLRGLMPGDNVVWQVDSIDDYVPFVEPYCRFANDTGQRLVYFRFAEHAPLTTANRNTEIIQLYPQYGFEPFISRVHKVISDAGRGTLYLFDCLSDLVGDWCSDRMLGNFFMLTCPYLYDRAAIAYFGVFRNKHSFHATRPIANTTQILIDAYRHKEELYIHPIKVQHRHSNTMYMLHVRKEEQFLPVTQSCTITEIISNVPWSRSEAASYMLGYWSRTFAEAEVLLSDLDSGFDVHEKVDKYFHTLLRMLISHDEPVLKLAAAYFTLRDLVSIRKRMIGTGLIGGKAVGMLLARNILRKKQPRWEELLETHDSFFVGADVFYTYLVQNGCWWMMQKHKSAILIDDETETARRRILAGEFPEYIVKQFSDMLDYFGQSPIIVRSSSLLEDNFGNAFAGKYESVFCANQGGPHKRLEDFLCAVRTVYASTMSQDALLYRRQRGLLTHDEQMGLLIQRVSGATYGNLFFPQAAGVGFSFNPYVWHHTIDPEAGMLRLVFGVGTRAVDRADDDYTRVVALNAPERRPEGNFNEIKQYAQRRVDVLDLEANQLISTGFDEIIAQTDNLPMEMFASRDRELERLLSKRRNAPVSAWVLTFDQLLTKTQFVADMREMLAILQNAYEYAVDVEFTLNFFCPDAYKINLVQCRPLQVKGGGADVAEPPAGLAAEKLLLQAAGAVIGKSTIMDLDWLIYVVPAVYANLSVSDRYIIARLIGEITHHPQVEEQRIMLIGPGRWGTTTPALGVPVSFAEINHISVLCEIVAMRDNLIPDVSLGTHFFNELVENDMLYLALFPNQEKNLLNHEFFEGQAKNQFSRLLPEETAWGQAVKVVKVKDLPQSPVIRLNANTLNQQVVCYLEENK